MNRLKRFWRLWKLSKYQDVFVVKDAAKLEALQAAAPEMQAGEIIAAPVEGDGGAVFIGEGTHDEFLEFEKEEQGLAPWYDRIKKL